MRVAVIGLGGAGGYIAASFVKSGIDVVGFARGEHLEAIQSHSIKIIEDDLDAYFEGAFDVVMFCV